MPKSISRAEIQTALFSWSKVVYRVYTSSKLRVTNGFKPQNHENKGLFKKILKNFI
jgi:hypothetical protein